MKAFVGGGRLRPLSRSRGVVWFLIAIQFFSLTLAPFTQAHADEWANPSDLQSPNLDQDVENILNKPLSIEEADPYGVIGTRFEVWKHGERTQAFDFQQIYGELSDRLTLVVGKNPSDLRVELIRNTESGRVEAHIIYQREGFLYQKWAGSRMIVGGAGHDFVTSVQDQNSIFLLDRSGRIYMIDRVNLRRLYGQYACPLWHVGTVKLEDGASYRLHIKKGTLRESGISAKLDPTLAKDLQELQHRWIKDGSIFVGKSVNDEPETIIDYFGRDHLLQAAYVSQARLLAIMEDYHVFHEKQRRQMDGITLELAKTLDREIVDHPEIFKNAERLEVQKTLAALDPANTLRGLQSLRTQVENTKADYRHSLLEWISENPPHYNADEIQDLQSQSSPAEKSRFSKLRETNAYQRLREVTNKLLSPASLLILSLIGFTAAGGVLKDFAAQPETLQSFKSIILSLEHVFPQPFNDAYRPLLVKALSLQYAFAATLLFGFGLAATLMKKPLDHATLIGVRLAGILTISPFYYLYKILGQKNAVFAARNSLWPTRKNGGLHKPFSTSSAETARKTLVTEAQERNRRRGLARLLAFAAISEEEGISFHGLSWLEIRLARLKKSQSDVAELSAKAHQDYKDAIESMDPAEIANAEYELNESSQKIALEFREKDEDIANDLKLIGVAMDQFLAEARSENAPLPSADEIAEYRAKARQILEVSRKSSRAVELLNQGILSVTSLLKYDVPYHINLFGLDVFRENLLRAEPNPVVGGQILSQWWVDTLATQFVLEAFWSGWPLTQAYESAKNDHVYSGQGPPNPQDNPELFGPDGKLQYQFLGSRADFRQPGELFAQANDFAFTHSGQNVSFWDNHLGYLVSLQARSLYELGANADIENPYAIETPSTPEREKNETAAKSLRKWLKIIFQPRLAGYRSYFQNKRDNVFRFFPLNFLLMSMTRKAFLTNASIANIPFMVFFFQSVNMWAYAWPWAPIQLGITRVGEQNAHDYAKFTMIRQKLSESIRREHPEDAIRYTLQLIDLYRAENVRLESIERLKTKSIAEWTMNEMKSVYEESTKVAAVRKEINKKVQEGLNMLGGYLTTGLAIPFLILAIRPDMSWPVFGTIAGTLGLLGYPIIDRLFKWQARWAERKWDPLKRKRGSLKRAEDLEANYAFEASRVLMPLGEIDYEKASPEQQKRIIKFREQLAKRTCTSKIQALAD